MLVVSHKIIEDYFGKHTNAKVALESWYCQTESAAWNNLNDIKKMFNSVDYVGNDRFVFNIRGNNYRLVAQIIFAIKIVRIRFIGTHAEYDKINCSTI
jgi:mRNA interferase HigB